MSYEYLLENFLFPIVNIFAGRRFWFIYKDLRKSEWWSLKDIKNLELERLKKLVKHAYTTVPMYREIMDKNKVRPEDIKSLADLKKLPIVSKNLFRKYFPKKCTSYSVSKKGLIFDSTSGSTGSPFQFIRDSSFSDNALANTYRNHTWTGTRIGERTVLLWGQHKSSFRIKLLDLLLRRKFYSSFDVEKNYEEYYLSMKQYKPQLLEAYSASLTYFAKLLKENGMTDLSIPATISSAETLYPKNRRLIEEVLHTKVFNRYGSRELGNIAHECKEQMGLHLNAESYIVEIIKMSKKDKIGRIIVTNLTNFAMPFIRYDTEDYGVASSKRCACGRNLPLLKKIEGRIADFIKLPDGKELPFLFFNYFFEQHGAFLRQFQVIQNKKNHIILRLVVTEEYNSLKEKEILAGLNKKLGKMKITIEKTDKIECERSGKLRPVKRLI